MASIPDRPHQSKMRELQAKPGVALLVLLLAAAVAGCASYSKIKNSIPELNPEQVRIYFYRSDSSLRPNFSMPDIELNNEVVGKMVRGFFYVDRPPGGYRVVAQYGFRRGNGWSNSASLYITLAANQTLYVRSSTSYGFYTRDTHHFELVNAEKALIEMQHLGYTGTEVLSTSDGSDSYRQ